MFKLNLRQSSQNRIEKMMEVYKKANPYRYAKTETEKNRYSGIIGEFYKEEIQRRYKTLRKVEENPQLAKTILEYISHREAIGDFIVDWMWGYDPRNAGLGLPPTFPMIPFERQLEFIEWVYNLYLNQESGMVEKTRDAGATVFLGIITIFEWRWCRGFAGGVGSNKLENVDKRGNPDCLFEKFRFMLKTLPNWWMPRGYLSRQHDKTCNLINPEMGSQIAGQGGRDIGRGGRRAFYWVDEKASLDFPEEADMALSQNTRCQIDLSTPKGMNHYGQKIHSGRWPVFTFRWEEDPRKDKEWYDHECDRLEPEVVAQEIDINYHASVEGLFIKPEWVDSAFRIKLKAKGAAVAGLDVAAGGKNNSALCQRRGPVGRVVEYNIENGIELTHEVIDKCNQGGMDTLHYDKIGVGHVVSSAFESTEIPVNFEPYGLDAGGRASDRKYEEFDGAKGFEIFLNARAEWWYLMARRLKRTNQVERKDCKKYQPHELIDLEPNPKLKAQLCSVRKFRTETGKIKAESKQSLINRGVQSPDQADAAVMSYLPPGGGHKHIAAGYSATYLDDVNIEWNKTARHNCYNYCALSLTQSFTMEGVFGIWNEHYGKLYIYSELSQESFKSEYLVEDIVDIMHLREVEYEKIVGNHYMFKEDRRSVIRELNDQFYEKISEQTISVGRSFTYDCMGAVTILNRLIENRAILIDKGCKNLHNAIRRWKLKENKVQAEGVLEALLLVISELKQVIDIEEIIKSIEYRRKFNNPEPPRKAEMGV